MPFDCEVSAALLSEIWSALRAPVMPWGPALAGEAIRERVARACKLGRGHVSSYLENILFRAAGKFEFAPGTRAELIQVLGMLPRPDPGRYDGPTHAPALFEPSLATIAAFCMKLEMFGFEIDSGPVCEAARAGLHPRCKHGKTAAPREMDAQRIEERLRKRVTLRAKGGRGYSKVRTLRTHRGFIIQSYLGRDLEPLRLDVFGPKYNRVGDWMALLKADAAWSLELRDAPGYNPDFPRNAALWRKSG